MKMGRKVGRGATGWRGGVGMLNWRGGKKIGEV